MSNTIATMVTAIAGLITSVGILLSVLRVYKKVDGLASAQAERIDQLSTTIAAAPGVHLPERLPNGEPPPKPNGHTEEVAPDG